jgi:hypothetical protein
VEQPAFEMSLGKAPVAQNIQVVTDAVNQILQDKLATILTEFYTTEQQLRVQKEGLQEKLEKQLIEIQVSKVRVTFAFKITYLEGGFRESKERAREFTE